VLLWKDVVYQLRRIQDKPWAAVGKQLISERAPRYIKLVASVVVLSHPTSCYRTLNPPISMILAEAIRCFTGSVIWGCNNDIVLTWHRCLTSPNPQGNHQVSQPITSCCYHVFRLSSAIRTSLLAAHGLHNIMPIYVCRWCCPWLTVPRFSRGSVLAKSHHETSQ
jgi:hypothetical protein